MLAYLAAAGGLLGNSPQAKAEAQARYIHEGLSAQECEEHCYWRFEHCPGIPCIAWRNKPRLHGSRSPGHESPH